MRKAGLLQFCTLIQFVESPKAVVRGELAAMTLEKPLGESFTPICLAESDSIGVPDAILAVSWHHEYETLRTTSRLKFEPYEAKSKAKIIYKRPVLFLTLFR